MQLTLQRGTAVSLHRQLVTQLALQIATGTLPEGARLPSVRALSARLDIHYNTCLAAYQELAQLGLVTLKTGSGAIVSRFRADASWQALENDELHQMVAGFVRLVLEKGYTWAELQGSMTLLAQSHAAPRRLVFVDEHADILPVFAAELGAGLGQSVETITLEALAADAKADTVEATYLVSRYFHKQLQAIVGAKADILLMDIDRNEAGVARIQSMAEGELIVLVSVSPTLLGMAEAMVTGMRGHELLIRTVTLAEGELEIAAALRHARVIIADTVLTALVETLTDKPVTPLRIIPDLELAALCERLARGRETQATF